MRSFAAALQLPFLWEYWLTFKSTFWEIFWGASITAIAFATYTLYHSPSKTTMLVYVVIVEFVAGYFIWRADHLRLSEAGRAQQHHMAFGEFMGEGEGLARDLRAGMRDYGVWLQKRRLWVERVSDYLTNLGLPDEAAAFRHAGESDPDPAQLVGPNQALYWHRFYGGQLDEYREKLSDIIARRLDFHV